MSDLVGVNRKNRLFANIGKLITSSLDSKTILEKIMMEVKLYFNPQHWSLIKYDHSSNLLYFAIVEGLDFDQIKDIKLKPNEGIAGTVVSTGESIFVPDTSVDERFTNKVDLVTGFKTETIIAVPIKIRDQVYGVIEIINHENHGQFSAEDHLILQSIADFSGIAFYNNSIYEQAVIKSEIDSLTGLYNRGKLESIIENNSIKYNQGRRDSDIYTEVIIVYIDLDKFKEINDNYGHAEGDEVLKKVALSLGSVFRSDDLIFRIGGDEFIVLLKLEEGMDANPIIKRIQDVLIKIDISSLKKNYSVKFSFGIKSGLITEIKNLIHEADLLMYENKWQDD